jgi:predicted enzyme related to lactoylglutathione lyase
VVPTIDPTRLCQLELKVANIEASLAFYRQTFGWLPSPCEIYRYHVLQVPESCPFGIALVHDPARTYSLSGACLTFQIASKTEGVDTIANAAAMGGRILREAAFQPGYGWVWELADLDGQRFGLFLSHNKY